MSTFSRKEVENLITGEFHIFKHNLHNEWRLMQEFSAGFKMISYFYMLPCQCDGLIDPSNIAPSNSQHMVYLSRRNKIYRTRLNKLRTRSKLMEDEALMVSSSSQLEGCIRM